MDEERKLWDRMDEEPMLWYGRFRAFLLMGSRRSVNAVFSMEQESTKNDENLREPNAPGEWYKTEKEWNWKERAHKYDEHWIEEQDEIIRQEREKVLRLGFALDYKRIEALNKLADKMIQWADEDDKVWIVNKKTVTGENFSQYTEETVFNAPMLGMIEKYFAGIAAEKGERIKKKDITLTEMPPSVYMFDPDQDGTEVQPDGN